MTIYMAKSDIITFLTVLATKNILFQKKTSRMGESTRKNIPKNYK